jgi:hypothetical protein
MEIISSLEQAIAAIHDYFVGDHAVSAEHPCLSDDLHEHLVSYVDHNQDALSVADLHQLISAVNSHGVEAPSEWHELARGPERVTAEQVRIGHEVAKAALKFKEYGGYPDKPSYEAAWRAFEESTGHTTD